MKIVAFRIEDEGARGLHMVAAFEIEFGGHHAVFKQRRPGAQIVPAEAGANAEDVRLPLALGRAWLQHRIIDADVLALGIEPPEDLGEAASAVGCGNFLQQGRGFRQVLAERGRQGRRRPYEHAAVPEKISCPQKFDGAIELGFFGKAPHPQSAAHRFAGFNIPVPGLGPGRIDSHDDDVFTRRRNCHCLRQIAPEAAPVADDVVGGKHADDGFRVLPEEQKRGQPDRRRRIASQRLGDHLPRRQLGQLANNVLT